MDPKLNARINFLLEEKLSGDLNHYNSNFMDLLVG